MLTEKTKRAIAVIESVDPARHLDLLDALSGLATWAEETGVASATVKTVININNQSVEID